MKKILDSELDSILQRWRPDSSMDVSLVNSRLKPTVWRRIAVREKGGEDFFFSWLMSFFLVVARPVPGAILVVSFIFMGLFMAEVRWQQSRSVHIEQIEFRYFQSIDPLSMAAHRHNL